MNIKEKEWLLRTIMDFVIDHKEIQNHKKFLIKLYTHQDSSKVPLHVTTEDDELIFFSVLDIHDEQVSEVQDINYDGYNTIRLGHEISKFKNRAPQYEFNNSLSSESQKMFN